MRKKALITVKNLSKQYKNFFAIKNINLKIYEGERIAIIGANGAGKSTLVDIIGGIKTKSSGSIVYGLDNPKTDIALQIQDTSFPAGIKLKDIFSFYCTIFKKDINSQNIQDLIKFFRIEAFWNKEVSKLSGGQKQRVNASLTLISIPKVLIIDEMATGLDITTRLELITFINDYVKKYKITYISISHSEGEIAQTTDRIIIMDNGRIIKDTTMKDMGGEKGIFKYFKKKVRGK